MNFNVVLEGCVVPADEILMMTVQDLFVTSAILLTPLDNL